MWTTCAMVAALILAPGASGELALNNARATYGILGATRPDHKFLPGDIFLLAFDIEGVQVDESGKVLYSMAMEVSNAAGKVLFKQSPRDLEANNSLGGTSLPAFARLQIGLDQPPGDYTLKVKVTDRAAKASQTLTSSYQVLPKSFGLVNLAATSDPAGNIPAPFYGEGQTIWINFAAVGFGRQQGNKQPQVNVVMRVLDEEGRPTLAKPFEGEINQEISEKVLALPMQFVTHLNRAGKFSVELKATDKTSGESTTLTFPLVVMKTK